MNRNENELPYERSKFKYTIKDAIVEFYLKVIEEEDELVIIFDRYLMLRLIKRNELWFAYGSDELKNDK